MSTTTMPPTSPAPPSSWARVAGVVALLTTLTAVMLIAFALPGVNSGPHHVPVAVAGPPAATEQVSGALAQARPAPSTSSRWPTPTGRASSSWIARYTAQSWWTPPAPRCSPQAPPAPPSRRPSAASQPG